MFKQTFTAVALCLAAGVAVAQPSASYEVTITNITPGQSFTPQLVVTHPGNVILFRLGEPASEQLEILAEAGDTGPLTEALGNAAMDVTTIPGLLGPGQQTSTVVTGHPGQGYISVAAMLIPTNDSFVAMNRVKLPASGAVMQLVPAYDAGTEYNDQNCANIPGPQCGGAGEGYSPGPNEGDEGFVHIGNGIHELGEEDATGNAIIDPKTYDWRNSVARITVRRMN
jgi:hypothetical protein